MKTEGNLKKAFAGESQANRKYIAFADQAEKEGLKEIAKLFRAAADAETVHAIEHLKAMGGIRSTKQNLKEAIEGETHEFQNMYPGMIQDAKDDKHQDAHISFFRANKVEEIHAGLYKKALEALESERDLNQERVFVCQVCGNTVEADAPDTCPICGAKKSQFKEIR